MMIQAFMFLLFFSYPMINLRLLRLYDQYKIGEAGTLLRADKSMRWEDGEPYRAAGGFFLMLYVVGIFFIFAAVLARYAMPQRHGTKWAKDNNFARYGSLYSAYEPRCWWWELAEVVRKLALTGIIVFIAPGTTSQSWGAMVIGLFFLLLLNRFAPYEDSSIDHLAFVAQLCTFLTLLMAVTMATDITEEEPFSADFIDAILLVLMAFPFLFAITYNVGRRFHRAASSEAGRERIRATKGRLRAACGRASSMASAAPAAGPTAAKTAQIEVVMGMGAPSPGGDAGTQEAGAQEAGMQKAGEQKAGEQAL